MPFPQNTILRVLYRRSKDAYLVLRTDENGKMIREQVSDLSELSTKVEEVIQAQTEALESQSQESQPLNT